MRRIRGYMYILIILTGLIFCLVVSFGMDAVVNDIIEKATRDNCVRKE